MENRVQAALHRTLEFIKDSPVLPLRIGELAEQAQMSPSHFCRSFRAEFGTSPHQFMTRIRLERAKEKLRQGSDPIIDISLDLGFCHQPYFTSWFRRFTGMTPRVYRCSPSASGPSAS